MNERELEIRPHIGRTLWVLAPACAVFAVAGVAMVITGDVERKFAGVLCILFFGVGGGFAIPRIARRRVSLVLGRETLTFVWPLGRADVPWTDIEDVGTFSIHKSKFVGVRLTTYDRFLRSMSPELAASISKSLPYMRLLAKATSLADAPKAVELWTKLSIGESPEDLLKGFAEAKSLASAMAWSRKTFGFDICLGRAELDRGAEEFAQLLLSRVPRHALDPSSKR